MTAASTSDARKRRLPEVDPVEVVVCALDPVVPNSDGVIWNYQHEDGQQQPVTIWDAARDVVAALRDAGVLA